jgi:hypothetical protein
VAQSGNGKQRQEKPRNQKAEKETAHRARAEDGQPADFHHAEVTTAPAAVISGALHDCLSLTLAARPGKSAYAADWAFLLGTPQ